MMRSKRSSRNSARAALNSLCSAAACLFLCGCFFLPSSPTYTAQNIAASLEDLAREEYKIDIACRLVGSTLWVYMPVEDLFIANPKPEKYLEKFEEPQYAGFMHGATFGVKYKTRPAPVKEKSFPRKINNAVSEQLGVLWKVVRRVLFNIEPSHRDDIAFVVMTIGDVKNGFEVQEIFYVRDLKKVSYGLISIWEFQHRVIQESSQPLSEVIGDRIGKHIKPYDITMADFINKQVEYRILLKFRKPEVEQNVDIDREVAKIVTQTLQMYEFTDIEQVDLKNIGVNKNMTLSYPVIWGKTKKK